MLLAWNNGDLPLHTGVLPPFLFGKGLPNHWVINEELSSDFRFVFDASWTISNFYLNSLDHSSYKLFGLEVSMLQLLEGEVVRMQEIPILGLCMDHCISMKLISNFVDHEIMSLLSCRTHKLALTLEFWILLCSTMAALEKVVKHAATTNLSEQLSDAGKAMLKICACLFGSSQHSNENSRRKKGLGDVSISMDLSVQLKDITVRIIHAGGRQELYRNEIPASKLMEKYPGMCVARPGVFKNPHESLLLAEEKLFPGHKYYIIPCTTVQKLKRKYSEKGKVKESAEGEEEEELDGKIVADVSDDCSEASLCSNDFHVNEEKSTKHLLRKRRRGKKPFVPPIQRPKLLKGMEWEPSLNSIQEISP